MLSLCDYESVLPVSRSPELTPKTSIIVRMLSDINFGDKPICRSGCQLTNTVCSLPGGMRHPHFNLTSTGNNYQSLFSTITCNKVSNLQQETKTSRQRRPAEKRTQTDQKTHHNVVMPTLFDTSCVRRKFYQPC